VNRNDRRTNKTPQKKTGISAVLCKDKRELLKNKIFFLQIELRKKIYFICYLDFSKIGKILFLTSVICSH